MEAGGDGVGELLEAAGEGGEHGGARGGGGGLGGLGGSHGFLALHHAEDEAAVGLLHVRKDGESAAEAEGFGVAGVDACHEGAGDLGEEFGAHAAADEGAKAFVGDGGVAADEEFEAHAEFAWPGDEFGAEDGEDHGGGHEHHAFGHGVELAFAEDVGGGGGGVVGADELVAEAEFAAEVKGGALLGEEGVGTTFDEEALAGVGDDLTAELGGGFEEEEVGAGFLESVGGCEA